MERSNIADISVIDDTNILFIQGKGRNDKDAYVKLSDEAYEAIVEYLSLRNDDNEALFVTHGHSSNGKRIQTRVIRGFIKDYFLRIGIENKNATAHSLRHFACSQILLNGGTLEEARQVLRHASISTTQIYNHALNRKDNNSEIRLSSKIKELMKED